MKRNEIVKLVSAILIPQFVGLFGSVFTLPSINGWYAGLKKPNFTPPSWLFGPAWVTLYLLMGVSLYLIWRKGLKRKGVKASMEIFGVQLALNALWSLLFFGLHSPLYGLVGIIVLWVAILATIIESYKVSRTAGMLLVPYILWVTFAMALNFSVWVLN
jgi:benzodiazapine receptor